MRKNATGQEMLAQAERIEADAPRTELPEMGPTLTQALIKGVEYVDATQLLTEAMKHIQAMHTLTRTIGTSLIATQQSLIRAHKKLIELEADMAGAGIGEAAPKSALIVPERLRN
jgi:hypothetical protein